ncbi:uncharacterized protein [Solanum lycopersicum]|uniref:uncharacterized protein n=1 Tax=Solanum lycopersicum TaxID=4081 RepID=UPI0037495BE0
MSFGLINAQAAFMDLMHRVFRSYLDSFVIVFIDDILVYSKNEGDHMDHLRVVLQVLKENQLFGKYRKCEFWLSSVAFLSHIISSEGVEIDPRKTETVKNWPRPLTPTDIRSFLGLEGYYRRKPNVVADALSRLSIGSMFHMEEAKRNLVKKVHRLARLGIQIEDSPIGGIVVHHNSESSLVVKVKSKQHLDQPLMELKFTYNNSYHSSISMASYESLYNRRCRSPIGWFEVDKSSILGPDLIYKTLEKVHIIRNQLQIAYSRKKSYIDHRRRELEFEEGDKVYLKILCIKGLVRFGKKGKLSPRYVDPYEILQRVGKVAYE